MLSSQLEKGGGESLYAQLYKIIKSDILSGHLRPGEKLPSKRALAEHLAISTVTVEAAYSQLLAEGYIVSRPRSGYYAAELTAYAAAAPGEPPPPSEDSGEKYFADLVGGALAADFPFSVWARLMRETMSSQRDKLMCPSPAAGVQELRQAIAEHLYRFRGMQVSAGQIVVGAGTEYLYGLIIQLLGRDKLYGVEDPGYVKIRRICAANGVETAPLAMDSKGISMAALRGSAAQVLHLTPSHHFPAGIVTSAARRYALLGWAAEAEGRMIIEDDYDSEFRLLGKPIPALQSMDAAGRVIYINTFSKSLSPTVRIAYMVLPPQLMERCRRELGFYSCTVSNFEQYCLAAFIRDGYFEKHINRMRKRFRARRDAFIAELERSDSFKSLCIRGEDAGLHFLLEQDTALSDAEIRERCREHGLRVSCLGEYYAKPRGDSATLVINCSALPEDRISETARRLIETLAQPI